MKNLDIHVLHLTSESTPAAIRVQRYLQSNINMGIRPIVLCRISSRKEKTGYGASDIWLPNFDKSQTNYYKPSRLMSYLLPPLNDEIGLEKIYNKYKCDLVHAHSPETAYYSYKLGLPTIFDDWEYWLEHADYMWEYPLEPLLSRMKHVTKPRQIYYLALAFYKKKRIKKIVEELVQNIPLIVTNEELEQRYRELGASNIYSVPNVPMSYEREYALAVEKKKMDTITTCYIGNMTMDEKNFLRNTLGIRDLWNNQKIGKLYIFEGKNYVPHLEVLRKVRECHFNLLFWKPLPVHRFYLQNKAFLASVVGVPTIISSSLKATINLLGDFALPVNSLNEIPQIIKSHDYSREYSFNPAHLWEYHEAKIKAAYENVLNQ